MGIMSKFTSKVKKYMSEADERAEKRLQRAKTQTERENIKAQLLREKLKARKEIAEAKTALLKAEASRRRAAKEVKDIGNGVFSGLRGMLGVKKKARRKRCKK